jgi:hypothetical protein
MTKEEETKGRDESAILEYEPVIRQMLSHEDDLTNQRMLWSAAFNGLLFAALGFTWGKADSRTPATIFCCLGMATSALTTAGTCFAVTAQLRLLDWWSAATRKIGYIGPGVMGGKPIGLRWLFYFSPWVLITACFVLGWFGILIHVRTH